MTPLVLACVSVLGIVDGDTLTVRLENVPAVFSPISVRIAGIDAPELHALRACERQDALRAKNTLAIALANQPCVTLANVRRDKYFRLLADVLTTENVGAYLLKNGYAAPYDGGQKKRWRCITSTPEKSPPRAR